MRLTQEVIEKIEKEYHKKTSDLGISVENVFTVSILRNNVFLCELDELTQLIDELLMMKEAIKEAAGIIV